MVFSDLSFRIWISDKEGMIPKGVGLLFFVLVLLGPLWSEPYLVQKGDTGSSIASKHKIPSELLRKVNPDLDWQHLKVGDRLTLPERYVVKAGDTLYSLCRGWGVDQADVLALNNLSGPSALNKGQTLFLPAKAKVSGPAAPVAETPATLGATLWPVDKPPRPEGDKLKSVTFATTGENFRSVSPGTVVYLGEFRGVGRVLLVQSPDKTVFAYGNFENATVEFGQSVSRGQVLGATSSRISQKLSFFAFRQTDSLDVFTVKR